MSAIRLPEFLGWQCAGCLARLVPWWRSVEQCAECRRRLWAGERR